MGIHKRHVTSVIKIKFMDDEIPHNSLTDFPKCLRYVEEQQVWFVSVLYSCCKERFLTSLILSSSFFISKSGLISDFSCSTSLFKNASPSVSSLTLAVTCLILSLNSLNWELSDVLNCLDIFIEMDVSALHKVVRPMDPEFESNLETSSNKSW